MHTGAATSANINISNRINSTVRSKVNDAEAGHVETTREIIRVSTTLS